MAKRKSKKEENIESGIEQKNSQGETSIIKMILMIAPLVGIALGVIYVSKGSEIFSHSSDKIELSNDDFKKVVIEIIYDIEELEKNKKTVSKTETEKIINDKFEEMKQK